MDRSDRVHTAALFRFFGLFRYGAGIGAVYWNSAAAELQFAASGRSIIEFWLRWHMTLTRFLTAYIYNPLSLWLTRRRMAKGRPGVVGQNTTIGAFCYLLMFPTYDNVRFWALAWRRLWIYRLGLTSRLLSYDQSRMALDGIRDLVGWAGL